MTEIKEQKGKLRYPTLRFFVVLKGSSDKGRVALK
jgi:hypothetical protein